MTHSRKKKIIITAGGTSEPIDGVRNITNFSSGTLGYEIVNEMIGKYRNHIHCIYYLCPKSAVRPPESPLIKCIHTSDVASVEENITYLFQRHDIHAFVHAMAVSDYKTRYVSSANLLAMQLSSLIQEEIASQLTYGVTPNVISSQELTSKILHLLQHPERTMDNTKKLSSSEDNLIVYLESTRKIIGLIKDLQPSTYLVGFKLLNQVCEVELCQAAMNLLQKNKCNMVVANDLQNITQDYHHAIVIHNDFSKTYAATKQEIATEICKSIFFDY